jgi:hypothetical protein
MDFFAEEFLMAMQQQNAAKGGNLPVDQMMESLKPFLKFCRDYLSMHQVQQLLTNVDGGYGVQLTNLKQFLIGLPLESMKGTMQPSNHVAVTGQQTARDMQQHDYVPMSGERKLIPPGMVNFESAQGQKDMTASQPEIRFDQADPRTLPSQR